MIAISVAVLPTPGAFSVAFLASNAMGLGLEIYHSKQVTNIYQNPEPGIVTLIYFLNAILRSKMCAPIAANAANATFATLAMLVNYIASAATIGTLLLLTFKGRMLTRILGIFRNHP